MLACRSPARCVDLAGTKADLITEHVKMKPNTAEVVGECSKASDRFHATMAQWQSSRWGRPGGRRGLLAACFDNRHMLLLYAEPWPAALDGTMEPLAQRHQPRCRPLLSMRRQRQIGLMPGDAQRHPSAGHLILCNQIKVT